MPEQPDLRRELLRGLRGGNNVDGNPYAGSDPANATRIVGLLWLLSAILTIAFLPFDPPTEAIGGGGVGARGPHRRRQPVRREAAAARPPARFNELLELSYLGLAQVAVLVWLGGGAGKLVREPLPAVARVGDRDPPAAPRARLSRRNRGRGVAAARIQRLERRRGRGDGDHLPAAAALGIVVLALMTYVRAQRIRLRGDEEHAQQLARADPLTGMGNRRAFDEALEAEIARARRAKSTMSVALLDLDNFKELNDRYGHLEGDRLLRLTGAAVERGAARRRQGLSLGRRRVRAAASRHPLSREPRRRSRASPPGSWPRARRPTAAR